MIQEPTSKIQHLARFARNPLISGSAVMFVGSLLGNVFHFLFNIFMSRSLSVAEYGILIALTSVATFPGFLFTSIVPTTVRFATTFITNNEKGKLKGLYIKISKIMFYSGVFFMALFVIFSSQIASFLRIENIQSFIWFLGAWVMVGLIGNVNMAFFQAQLSFKFSSFLTFLGGILKFIFGVTLVLLGFRIGGILVGIILSGFVVFLVGLVRLRPIFYNATKSVHMSYGEILHFGVPATLALLSVTSFINTDIILVKHFFPAHEAGLYAGLSLIGKVIFYFSAPIGAVMFPLIVKKHELGQAKGRMLLASLGLVLIPSVALTLFYFIFPEFTIGFFLKRADYLAVSGVLGFFGLFMALYAILYMLTNFYLSIKKTRIYIPIFVGALLQIVLISFFHESFYQVIAVSTSLTFLLVVGLLLYYRHATRERI